MAAFACPPRLAVIHVRRSVSWAKVRGEKVEARARFYEPKTKTSRRDIPLAPDLANELRRWKLQCPPTDLDLVFPSTTSAPSHRKSLSKMLQATLRRAKVKRVNLHSLRHTFASTLIMHGATIGEVSHLLGHSSPDVTLRVYTHWWKGMSSDSTTKLAHAILGVSGSTSEECGSKMVAYEGEQADAKP